MRDKKRDPKNEWKKLNTRYIKNINKHKLNTLWLIYLQWRLYTHSIILTREMFTRAISIIDTWRNLHKTGMIYAHNILNTVFYWFNFLQQTQAKTATKNLFVTNLHPIANWAFQQVVSTNDRRFYGSRINCKTATTKPCCVWQIWTII